MGHRVALILLESLQAYGELRGTRGSRMAARRRLHVHLIAVLLATGVAAPQVSAQQQEHIPAQGLEPADKQPLALEPA